MNETKAVGKAPVTAVSESPYMVYTAGGLFTQDELATNVMIKEAVWRLSRGKFELSLPQSREIRDLDRPDVKAHIRNTDLLDVITSDIILARFDGLEIDSGTVVEFVVAKNLGKPTVILRCDFRRMYGTGLAEPYNLMVKNWPRCVEIHLDSFVMWAGLFADECQDLDDDAPFQALLQAELGSLRKSVDNIAKQVIAGLEAVLEMESPFPPEYREVVYEAARLSIGSGFDQMLTSDELGEIIQRLRNKGTL